MTKGKDRGIIYIMDTIVPGLIKIGKTASDQYNNRMRDLENNGYRNVTGLVRKFAIEVDEYDDKEALLHTIFDKSRVGKTELFSVDLDIAKQLLASFDGKVVYPADEAKDAIFIEATDNRMSKLIKDGEYYYKRKKQSDGRLVSATAVVKDGQWTIVKGSILGVHEDAGVSKKTKAIRATISLSASGELLEDISMGECTPSSAGEVVMNQSSNGWMEWMTKDGQPIDIFRKKDSEE